LQSLANQHLPKDVVLRLIVVDNDARGSARDCVDQMSAVLPIRYMVEPTKGLSFVRNRALSAALEDPTMADDADYLAFIDDDERAAPDWLAQALRTARERAADVVFGPVISLLPPTAPRWLREGNFHARPRYPTGTPRLFGATNNALVSTRLLRRLEPRFSAEYAHSGGEDTDFFARLGRAKAVMLWCDEAVVSEDIPADRTRLRWLAQRHFRGGQAFARIFVPHMSWRGRLTWLAKRSLLFLGGSIACPLLWPLRQRWGIKALLTVVNNAGQLTGLSRFRYYEYAASAD